MAQVRTAVILLLAGVWQRSGSAAGRTTCPTQMALQLPAVKRELQLEPFFPAGLHK